MVPGFATQRLKSMLSMPHLLPLSPLRLLSLIHTLPQSAVLESEHLSDADAVQKLIVMAMSRTPSARAEDGTFISLERISRSWAWPLGVGFSKNVLYNYYKVTRSQILDSPFSKPMLKPEVHRKR